MDDAMIQALLRTGPFVLVLAVIALRVRQGRIEPAALDLRLPPAGRFLLWWLGFLLLIAVTETALFSAGLLDVPPWRHALVPSLVRIAGMVALAPIVEELLFRGIALNWLRDRLPSFHLAAAVQAVAFVALHNFTYSGTLMGTIGIVQTFVDACLFAYARRHTGSLLTPIAMHATGNLIATAEMFLL